MNADSATLGKAYDDFSQALSDLNRALEDLDAGLESSLAEWDGAARQAFDGAHRQWRQAAADMASQLSRLRKAITLADDNYARAEAANLKMFGRGL